MVRQRDIWWADFGEPIGSVVGFTRPVIILQSDSLNQTRIASYFSVPLTGNARAAAVPWNVPIKAAGTGLDKDSVAQVALALAIDARQLVDLAGQISERQLLQIFERLDIVLGRTGG